VKISRRSGGVIAAVAIVVAGMALLFSGAMTGIQPRTVTQGLSQPVIDNGMATTTTTDTAAPIVDTSGRIAVGGGNLTMSINQFLPSITQIQPGQSVTFYAPRGSTELHNVVLDLSNGSAVSSIELAFIFPQGFSPGALQLAPPDNFGEPIIQTMNDGRQSIVALNKVLFHPSTVDQNGDATFLQEQELLQQTQQQAQQGSLVRPSLSANYTMQGNEVVVSSGLILDVMGFAPLVQEQGAQQQQQQQPQEPIPPGGEELLPPAYPILSNFTVTFNEPGAYSFFCAFHPGMAGIVNVVDAAIPQNQAGT